MGLYNCQGCASERAGKNQAPIFGQPDFAKDIYVRCKLSRDYLVKIMVKSRDSR